MKLQTQKGKVGLFGIGLAAYWPQFKGLKQRLQSYQRLVAARLGEFCDVVDAGLVDTAPKAAAAGELFTRESVELVLCYVATYATSSQVLPAVQKVHAPVLILNLQPASTLNYAKTGTGEWLANCCACCVPEISCAFARSRIDFQVVTGVLGVERGRFGEAAPDHPDSVRAWKEISDWVRAASAVSRLKRSRIGFLGHTYPGMLDMYSDLTQHTAQLGTHIEVLEMCDLAARLPKPGEHAVAAKLRETKAVFDIRKNSPSDPLVRAPKPDQLQWACRVAVALDRLVADFDLQGLAYYYRGLGGNEYERLAAGMILGCSLLTARGVACSGEGDLKNCQAMKILDLLGCGGSYTEFYAMDFDEDFLLMGHDGPFHLGIAEGRPMLRGLGLFHGKRGVGVSVEARVKLGPVTLLAMTQTAEGQLKLIATEGESIAGPTLQIGNTNSRIRFKGGMTHFVNQWCLEGPTHHCALGVGQDVTGSSEHCLAAEAAVRRSAMNANPFFGVVLHALGGFAAGSFYIPFKQVRKWAWESYWLVGGFFSWIIAPWVVAWFACPNLLSVLREAPPRSLFWSYCFGVLWGIGGLTFGLSMRYLGMSLGYALALGFCAAFGTIIPPIFNGQFLSMTAAVSGWITLAGVLVCLGGIAVCGKAGVAKERELSAEQKRQTIREFNFGKGVWVAMFAGVMSACMAFAIAAGKPIASLAVERGTSALRQNTPVFVVILAGGFTTNFLWCVALNWRNRTGRDYISGGDASLAANYFFSALAGITWYLQFMFYGMGTTQMGRYDFSSWTIHMAFIIVFSNLWGLFFKEWKGASVRTHRLIVAGILALIGSTLVVGLGNYVASLKH